MLGAAEIVADGGATTDGLGETDGADVLTLGTGTTKVVEAEGGGTTPLGVCSAPRANAPATTPPKKAERTHGASAFAVSAGATGVPGSAGDAGGAGGCGASMDGAVKATVSATLA